MKNWIILMFTVVSLLSHADYRSAIAAYENQDFKSAYDEFYSLATIGEKRSQFNLGVMYFQGQYVEQDLNKAYAWIKLANQTDILNESYEEALNTIRELVDEKLAEKEYERLENDYGLESLKDKLYPKIKPQNKGQQVKATYIKKPRYPREAAKKGIQGYVRFKFDLDPSGKPRNIQVINAFPENVFEKSAFKALTKWQFEPLNLESKHNKYRENIYYTLNFVLEGMEGVKPKRSFYSRHKEGAKKGDIQSEYMLGLIYEYFNGLEEHGTQNEWYLKAALKGHPVAQYKLGENLVLGKGCEKSTTKGIAWLARAAANGQADAKQKLGILYSEKNDLESQILARDFLESAVEVIDSDRAKYRLAKLLLNSPFDQVRDAEKAKSLVDSINWSKIADVVSKYELLASAYAALGDMNKAIEYQEEALEEAEDGGFYTNDIADKLTSFKLALK